jgi:hypothetical protein
MEDVGQKPKNCVIVLVTGNVTVAMFVCVLVAEAEVTVVVAAGLTGANTVLVAVEVSWTVVVATVLGVGWSPNAAVKGRGVFANGLRNT